MSAIFRIFKLSVDPENELAYQTIGHQNLEQSMVTETGTLAMYAGHSIDNPLHTVVAEVYQNQAAYETHIASQHFKDFSQMANEALDLYDELAGELAENPEFLADYVAVLRQLGRLEDARLQAHRYIQLVPDDLAMQEFLNEE